MANIKELMRYIDDGAGFYIGSVRSFNSWMNAVIAALRPYNLFIDESMIKETFGHYISIYYRLFKSGNTNYFFL